MTFLSFAQNFEDVMLHRALSNVHDGFFIDVGAWKPDLDSVTQAFSMRGWRGVNIEPNPVLFPAFRIKRPNDVNLCALVGGESGCKPFHLIGSTGLSTVSDDLALSHKARFGYDVRTIDVPVTTLKEIFDDYAPENVHFLKIDAEGSEEEVLLGADFQRHRPWILVIEANLPFSKQQSVAWETIPLRANYKFVYYDGLNRFYIAEEHMALSRYFLTPPNVFDDFVKFRLGFDNLDSIHPVIGKT